VSAGLLVAGIVGGAAVFGATQAQAEKQFELVAWSTDAVVEADGDMTVVERITYDFTDGPFRRGSRTFDQDDLDRISDFTASEGEQRLEVVAPPESELDGYRWLFDEPVIDGTHTYSLSYTVEGAMTAGTDVAELYWKFLGADHPGVGSFDVTITLPTGAPPAQPDTPATDATVLRAFAHGPRNGTVRIEDNTVTLQVDDVPAETFVEARLVAPAGDFTISPTGGERLATILDEERSFQDGGSSNDRPGLGHAVVALGALLGLGGLGGLHRKYGREPAIDPLIGKYWREPLDDPPAITLALLSNGTVNTGPAMSATLLDLAQRGHLRISATKVSRFGPDTVEHTYTYLKRADALRPFEQSLLSYVFAGKAVTTGEEISARSTADPKATNTWVTAWREQVTGEYASRNYTETNGGSTRWILLVVLCVVVAALGMIASGLGSKAWFVLLIGAFGLFGVGLRLLGNRTAAGAEARAKAVGLRKFLKDFGNLSDAPVGHLILWERFLVFAVAFGVAKELLGGLSTRLPQIISDPAFGGWYIGPGGVGSVQDFPGSWGSTTGAAIEPASSSGSGGGFSDGGGGGGGGGGAGAD
jgi:hypothetical protein